MSRLGIAVFLFALVPLVASAHAGGASLERRVGDYFIDIGYDTPQIYAGERTVFDFNLTPAAASTTVPYDYAWVRVRLNGTTVLATGIMRADIGPTTLLYAVPENAEGTMALTVRYQKDEETLAESEFELPVIPLERSRSWWLPYAGAMLTGIAIGALAALAVFARKKRV